MRFVTGVLLSNWKMLAAGLCLVSVFSAGCRPQQESDTVDQALESAPREDFSYAYWLNGHLQPQAIKLPRVLCLESEKYGMKLDMANLRNPHFSRIDDGATYKEALSRGADRLADLETAELEIALTVQGKKYQAVSANGVRMWEVGRIAQHIDFNDLQFKDDAGNLLDCYGRLTVAAWPKSLSFSAEINPDFNYTDGPTVGLVGNGHCIADEPLDIALNPDQEPQEFTAEMWVKIPKRMPQGTYSWMLCKNGNEHVVGNFGFQFRRYRVLAFMNNGGGSRHEHSISESYPYEWDEGGWQHLALSYDGKMMRFYRNGQLQGAKEVDGPRPATAGQLTIGNRCDRLLPALGGIYDQVRIWNRALPAEEIAAHVHKPTELPSREGLILEKEFDEGPVVKQPVWKDAELSIRFKTAEKTWETKQTFSGVWKKDTKKQLTLNCEMDPSQVAKQDVAVHVVSKHKQPFPVTFDPALNCFVADVKNPKRGFADRYVKITEYDEFDLSLESKEDAETHVPFMFYMREPANITGLVPILCKPDGTPTGVHVQLSKNWHYKKIGNYLRAYALVPVKPGANRFRLRIPYGFYGTLPSASHAQLSLVGAGGEQRWEQFALACGGEAITFDSDMSHTNVAICDVRMPLGQAGKESNPWTWTEAGWGGDWLRVFDADRAKLAFTEMKVAYLSHGPCLADIMYKGFYGAERDVEVNTRIQFPRSDDYARTFQKLDYRFKRKLSADDSYLMQRAASAWDRVVVYGNGEGVIEEKRISADLKANDVLIPAVEMKGPGPWWVAFPDRNHDRGPAMPTSGYISWVIRDYQSSFGGTAYSNPFLQVVINKTRAGGEAMLEARLVPPPHVRSFDKGDSVLLDTAWLHLVTEADNYGGLNEVYRKHLEENPRSWKTTYREVKGNSLQVGVEGGTLLQNYPIVIGAEKPEVTVTIKGGIGYLPIRFEGLKIPDGYAIYEIVNGAERKLDQSVHGNDCWQTDHDATTDTYQMTFNLPVDGKPESQWVLKQENDNKDQ